MITLLVRSPIYTRIYSPELYGLYSIVYISFTYLSAISYQWITNNAWRYYLKYKNSKTLGIYWSVTIYLILASAIIIAIICLIWFLLSDNLLLKKLILFGGLYFFTNELVNILLVPARITGKAGYYNILNSIRALGSFLLLLALTFGGNAKIEAFFSAPLIVNAIYILLLTKKPLSFFSFKIDRKLLRHVSRFINYGLGNLFFSVGLFLLISSDRYLIAYFDNYDKVGIYNQTYNLGQISIAALFTVLSAALNPTLISNLNKKPFDSDNKIYDYLYVCIYIILPVVLLVSLFSKEITYILLGKGFREAWNLLPIIFFSAFLSGLNHFAVIKLKFTYKLKVLILDSLSAAALNILLNFILIPIYGYKIAAFTTLLSYLYLLIVLYYHAKLNPFTTMKVGMKIIRVLAILSVLCLIHFGINHFFHISDHIFYSVIESIIFVTTYFVLTRKIIPLQSEEI